MIGFFGVWDSIVIVYAVVLHEPVTFKQLSSHGRNEFITQGFICPLLRYLISVVGPCSVTRHMTWQWQPSNLVGLHLPRQRCRVEGPGDVNYSQWPMGEAAEGDPGHHLLESIDFSTEAHTGDVLMRT